MAIVILLSLLMHTQNMFGIILLLSSLMFTLFFNQFQTLIEHQFSLKIKSVQTNWGGECRKLSTFFKTIGIQHCMICPHTHEQNDIVERRHKHIVETCLTLIR
jgi:hypothetical protein